MKKSTFVSCSIQGAVVNTDINGVKATGIFSVVSGGAGMSLTRVLNLSIDGCTFTATGGGDSSESSTGVLVLASNSARSRATVSDTIST
jgi:hypothetical protein